MLPPTVLLHLPFIPGTMCPEELILPNSGFQQSMQKKLEDIWKTTKLTSTTCTYSTTNCQLNYLRLSSFRKCNSEVKLFSNWQNQRPLVKYHKTEPDALTPFYTDDAAQRELESNIIGKCIHKMSGLLDLYEQTSFKCKQNYIDCHLIIKFLFEYMEMYKRVKEKRFQIVTEIKRYLKPSSSYSSMRHPLRQVCFLITEILCFYRQEIFNIMKLLKPVYREANFLSEHEQSELDQLNNRCFQIVDMYIQLNDIRNEHFQQMYE